jgi:hypothetical protein
MDREKKIRGRIKLFMEEVKDIIIITGVIILPIVVVIGLAIILKK